MHFCSRTAADVEAANERYASEVPEAKAIGNVVDVKDAEGMKAWVDGAAKESGGVDVVVANVSSLSHEVSDTTKRDRSWCDRGLKLMWSRIPPKPGTRLSRPI